MNSRNMCFLGNKKFSLNIPLIMTLELSPLFKKAIKHFSTIIRKLTLSILIYYQDLEV